MRRGVDFLSETDLRLIKLVSQGVSIKEAAEQVGVGKHTAYNSLQRPLAAKVLKKLMADLPNKLAQMEI